MDHQKVLVPESHHQTADGQKQKSAPPLQRGAQKKVQKQHQQPAAETQGSQVVVCLEGLDVLGRGQIGGLDEAAVPVDEVGKLVDDLDLSGRPGV